MGVVEGKIQYGMNMIFTVLCHTACKVCIKSKQGDYSAAVDIISFLFMISQMYSFSNGASDSKIIFTHLFLNTSSLISVRETKGGEGFDVCLCYNQSVPVERDSHQTEWASIKVLNYF